MKRLGTLAAIAIVIMIAGCGSPMKAFNTNSNGWKPADFVPANGILLIERTWPKNQQKKIEAFMAKSYPYKYEFADTKDLSAGNSRYADKNIYHFALVCSYSSHDIHQGDASQRPLQVGAFDYNFVDRLKDKEYPKSGIASSWASMTFKKIIETCLKN